MQSKARSLKYNESETNEPNERNVEWDQRTTTTVAPWEISCCNNDWWLWQSLDKRPYTSTRVFERTSPSVRVNSCFMLSWLVTEPQLSKRSTRKKLKLRTGWFINLGLFVWCILDRNGWVIRRRNTTLAPIFLFSIQSAYRYQKWTRQGNSQIDLQMHVSCKEKD